MYSNRTIRKNIIVIVTDTYIIYIIPRSNSCHFFSFLPCSVPAFKHSFPPAFFSLCLCNPPHSLYLIPFLLHILSSYPSFLLPFFLSFCLSFYPSDCPICLLTFFLFLPFVFFSGGKEVIKAFLLVGAERERRLLEKILHRRAEFTGQPLDDFTLSNTTSNTTSATSTSASGISILHFFIFFA